MSLAPGTRLGPYEITGILGAGGMGEVYRARDPRLDRDVALKVLPEGLTADAERLARFEREARVLAQVHHPHIAAIFGLEEGEGRRALVMELVEGATLAERLAAGPLPFDEVLSIARQIAEALEAAHEKGIVHRDLKPANVKAPVGGEVKVLDFGLAKATDAATSVNSATQLAQSPTLTMGATQFGVVLGTAAYMAPEQAKGLAVDKRADIWAFGVVLYEMLSGRSPFAGETVTDTLAAVLKTEVDHAVLPASTPPSIRRLLRRCIERDPRLRLRDIGEARVALANPYDGESRFEAVAPPRWRSALPWALAGALAVALGWAVLAPRVSSNGPPGTRAAQLALRLPPGLLLPLDDRGIYGQTSILAISPDASRVVFVGGIGEGARLYTRLLATRDAVPIEGSEGGKSPFFSPDGRWVGFFGGGMLRKALLEGGKPTDLAEASLDRGAVWCTDGSIVFAPSVASGLARIPAGGGEPVVLTTPDPAKGERSHRWPALLPGGREVAFTVGLVSSPGDYDDAAIDAVDLATGKRRPLLRGASMVRFTTSGHVLIGREGQVLALPLAAATGGGAEEARPVLRDVAGIPSSGVVHFDVAQDGTLVYAERDPRATERQLAWMSRDGKLENLPLPARQFQLPVLSPDGGRLAVALGPGGGRASDIWTHDLARGALARLTFDGRSNFPVWSRDGRSIAYSTVASDGAESFAERMVDGTAEARVLATHARGQARAAVGWMADGSFLWWEDGGAGRAGDLVYAKRDSREVQPFAATPAVEILAAVSPSGRYVAYAYDNRGVIESYVQPFPPTGAKWQVASDGTAPRFSRDGRELFYVSARNLMVLPVSTVGTFSSGPARVLLEVPPSVNLVSDIFANYDVAPDGRFLVVRSTSEVFTAGHLNVTLDWFEELRRAVPVAP